MGNLKSDTFSGTLYILKQRIPFIDNWFENYSLLVKFMLGSKVVFTSKLLFTCWPKQYSERNSVCRK